jgi:phospholipid transport system substrate-binding protein
MRRIFPRWPIALAAALALVVPCAATADAAAEAFVTEKANTALRILNDNTVPLEEKKERFRSFVDDVADVPRITRFVLGRYSRGLDADTMSEFAEVFRRYAISVYENRLSEYAGETLSVLGSTDRGPGDTIVHTRVTGGGQADPLLVNWRVLTSAGGEPKVVDVEVHGVWLAINQRDEIVSIIQNNGGRVDAATRALRGKLDELELAGG